MKSNQEIIIGWSDGLTGVTIDEAIPAMKEAQVEAIKELIRRKHQYSGFIGTPYKSIDNIALELIKEIKDGK